MMPATAANTKAAATASMGTRASHTHQRAMDSGSHMAPNSPTRNIPTAMGPLASQGSNFLG